MTKITVNIEIYGTMDADVIADEVNYHLRKQLKSIKSEPLKVGDYAKVVGDNYSEYYNSHGKTIGSIVKITGVFTSKQKYSAEGILDGDVSHYVESDLGRVTDEEVAEVKRQVVAEKWAKLGRKPNELKVGDVVRRAPGHYDIVANPYGGLRLDNGEELVAPVEARFDR
jgi:hypothetical protein